jgi:metal-responsive CopG/Arc/MetJ family transcriptional regulator
MDKKNADKTFTLRIPTPLFEDFRNKCNENYKTVSEAIRDLIRNYLKEAKDG